MRVFFVGTSSPTINAARVAQRVMDGGHSVPIAKIVSRYARSLANLPVLFALAQRVYVYDNSRDGEDARLCVRTVEGGLRKLYRDVVPWVEDAITDQPRHPLFEDLRSPFPHS